MRKRHHQTDSLSHSFQKQIKDYRLYCSINYNKIQFHLLDICEDTYYQIQYQENNLPVSFQKFLHSVEQLYTYVKQKTKIFKITGPGKVMCAQYMGRVEKYIVLEMIKMQPNQAILDNAYVLMLQRNCKQLLNKVHALKAELDSKTNSFRKAELNARKSKSKQKMKKSSRKMSRNEFHEQIETQFHQTCLQEQPFIFEEEPKDGLDQKQKELVKDQADNEMNADNQQITLEISKQNPFLSRFNIRSDIVQKINSSEPFQLFSNGCLNQKRRSHFFIKILKTKYNSICVGIVSLEYFRAPTEERQQYVICYNCYYGTIINQSMEERQNLPKMKEGSIIKTIVDLDQMEMSWEVNQQTIAKVSISCSLGNHQLYPFFEMQDKNDVIVLNTQ